MSANGTQAPAIGNAMVVRDDRTDEAAFEPRSIREGLELAKTLFASRLLPKAVASTEAAFTIMATGRELGLSSMQALRSIHIIEGKPTLSADLAVALAKRHPDCEFFMLVESTDKIATYETKRRGEPRPTRLSFTIEDAARAGLTGKDNWKKYGPAMLRARCSIALVRVVYPDAVLNLYDPDELDRESPRQVSVDARPTSEPATIAANFEPDDAELANQFAARVEAAATRQELASVAVEMSAAERTSRISAASVQRLKDLYLSAKKRFAKAEAPKPSDEPSGPEVSAEAREPGQEG